MAEIDTGARSTRARTRRRSRVGGGVFAPLSGILLAQFITGLSGTIVATSLPAISSSLDGPSGHTTWLVAATILANSATTPIWGKLGDRAHPKVVVQLAIGVFVLGTLSAGFAQNTTQLIGSRILQGIGLGGLYALVTIVVAALVAPRMRGRVNSWITSVQTTATIAGPVVGGIIVQAPGLGWRWCFFLSAPVALIAMLVVALRLRVPHIRPTRRPADLGGALLVGTGVSAVLVCFTMVGDAGTVTLASALVGGYGLAAVAGAIVVEFHVSDPIIPVRLLLRRTPFLCAVAAGTLGTTLFGGTVFVSQYLQLGLGMEPALAGLLLVPMALGTVATSFAAGRWLSATGRIRPVLVVGVSLVLVGNVTLALVGLAPIALAVIGTMTLSAGLGLMAQNLVLTVQSTVPDGSIGSSSATVTFFFSLGGASGLVGLGVLLSTRVEALRLDGWTDAAAYGQAVPTVFAAAAALVVPGLIAVLLLPDVVLRSSMTRILPESTPA